LFANNISYSPIKLDRTGIDSFRSDKWFFSRLVFLRGPNDKVIGFRVFNRRDETSIEFTRSKKTTPETGK